jgi:phosphoglycolate phosphatase-like HAD superfamily hydrolase
VRFIIELDGLVLDIVPSSYAVHRSVAEELGWSSLEPATFRRITRKDGRRANILPGAKPGKVEAYYARYAEQIETDAAIMAHPPQPDIETVLAALGRYGACSGITLGANLVARRGWVEQHGLGTHMVEVQVLDTDPRRRPGALKVLAEGDKRAIVIASGEGVLRAAGGAELFAVGMDTGLVSKKRLFQAGAAVVYGGFSDLIDSLQVGFPDLVQAGLLPLPMTATDT